MNSLSPLAPPNSSELENLKKQLVSKNQLILDLSMQLSELQSNKKELIVGKKEDGKEKMENMIATAAL
jgi:hypothetical protein